MRASVCCDAVFPSSTAMSTDELQNPAVLPTNMYMFEFKTVAGSMLGMLALALQHPGSCISHDMVHLKSSLLGPTEGSGVLQLVQIQLSLQNSSIC